MTGLLPPTKPQQERDVLREQPCVCLECRNPVITCYQTKHFLKIPPLKRSSTGAYKTLLKANPVYATKKGNKVTKLLRLSIKLIKYKTTMANDSSTIYKYLH